MAMPEVSSDSEERVYAVVEDLQGTHQRISIYHYELIDDYSCAYFNDKCLFTCFWSHIHKVPQDKTEVQETLELNYNQKQVNITNLNDFKTAEEILNTST